MTCRSVERCVTAHDDAEAAAPAITPRARRAKPFDTRGTAASTDRRRGRRPASAVLGVAVSAALFLLTGCGTAKTCSYTVDCTCQCQDCSGGSCSPLTKQYSGHACMSAEGLAECGAWVDSQKSQVEQLCLADCNQQIGIADITCDFAQTPGNPVGTSASVACALRK